MKRFLLILGVLLFVLGIIAVVHPSFAYHKREEVARIGSFKATVDEEKTTEIPVAVTVTLLVSGIVLVVLGTTRKP
jgi:uncharacterized membrane protein